MLLGKTAARAVRKSCGRSVGSRTLAVIAWERILEWNKTDNWLARHRNSFVVRVANSCDLRPCLLVELVRALGAELVAKRCWT